MSEGNILVQELNFQNMTVLYDGNKISRSVTIRHNLTLVLGSLLTFGLIFAVSIGIDHIVSIEQSFWLNFILSGFMTAAILILGLIILQFIDKKIIPPHYNVINWLKKRKQYEILLGWFNDQYIVIMNQTGRCERMTQTLKKFLEVDNYTLVDESCDKSKPVFATINLTNEVPSVHITNIFWIKKTLQYPLGEKTKCPKGIKR